MADKYKTKYQGNVTQGFEKVKEAFEKVLNDQVGASLSLYVSGDPVVDLWGGWKVKGTKEWTSDTLVNVFSCSKGVTNICCALLVDRGLLDYDQKISHYWPEFAQNGKESITVSQLLSHQAGLAILDQPITLEILTKAAEGDNKELLHILEKQKPLWEIGTGFGYHVFTVSFYANEIIKRVDLKHRSVRSFFKEEIMEPFGIEFYFGIESKSDFSESRISRLYYVGNNDDPISRLSTENLRLAHASLQNFNPWRYRYTEVPSGLGFSNARALAELIAAVANGGLLRGKKIFKDSKTISKALEPAIDGICKLSNKFNSYSKGGFFIVEKDGISLFGHGGFGGSLALGSTQSNIGFGFVTNTLKTFPAEDPRHTLLLDAVFECLKQRSKHSKL